MAKDLPPSIKELLRHRHTCLCLSDSTGSFRWGFFSYQLLPHLTQNDEYCLKGVFKRDCLILVVPFSKLPNKESVIGISYSYSDMNKFDLPCKCDIYFVNTNYPTLDNICFAVYINKDSSLPLDELQKTRFLDIRSIVFVNDAFQMNSASFYSLIEGVQKSQSSSPKLNLGYTIINLTGAQIGADSLDTPEIALAQSSKKMGDKTNIPAIEIDYNSGVGLEHISQLFSSNDDYARQLKANLRKEVKDLRDNKLDYIEKELELAKLLNLDSEWNAKLTAKTLSKSISDLQLTEIIQFVYPQFLELLEQLKTQSYVPRDELTRNWKNNMFINCNNTLKRLGES